jgi:hypothetical protein
MRCDHTRRIRQRACRAAGAQRRVRGGDVAPSAGASAVRVARAADGPTCAAAVPRRVQAPLSPCTHARARANPHSACVRACTCVRACLHVCVRACGRVCARARSFEDSASDGSGVRLWDQHWHVPWRALRRVQRVLLCPAASTHNFTHPHIYARARSTHARALVF